MAKSFTKLFVLSLLFMMLVSIMGVKTSQILQDNQVEIPKSHKRKNKTHTLADNTKNIEPNSTKTDKEKNPDDPVTTTFASYFNWEKIKDTIHEQKEAILYCS
jgi:hypothetical protein